MGSLAAPFNTAKFIDTLASSGMPEVQAQAYADALAEELSKILFYRSDLVDEVREPRRNLEAHSSHLSQEISAIRQKMTMLRTEIRQEVDEVQTRVNELRTEIKQKITEEHTERKQEISWVRTELKQEIRALQERFDRLSFKLITIAMILWVLGISLTTGILTVGVVYLMK